MVTKGSHKNIPIPDMKISVIVCTHNPRPDYLSRTLDALKSQSLPKPDWELLLIDNASDHPISDSRDMAWHPCAKHCFEPKLGLTPARLRGIQEARGHILVFVDDDNVLDADYLEKCWMTHMEMPWLGAWGGNIKGEFECQVPEFAKDFIHYLALRSVTNPKWACAPGMGALEYAPCGAGMVITRKVAEAYAVRLEHDVRLQGLDRQGNSLSSCGDTDLALTACDIGLAVGVFPQLRLVHLIPKERLKRDYLKRLVIGVDSSLLFLSAARGGEIRGMDQHRIWSRKLIYWLWMGYRKISGRWTDADQFRHELRAMRISFEAGQSATTYQ